MQKSDIVIIGAGVIGLSIAYELSGLGKEIIVLEKNTSFGQEASSRNSEVIHAGLYYQPGSLKAKTCIEGNKLLYQFCAKHNIPHKRLGKLVVASNDDEVTEIKSIYENALKCGVKNLMFLEPSQVKSLEPDITVKRALFSPDSGIIDSHSLMQFFFDKAESADVMFAFSSEVIAVKKDSSGYEVTVKEPKGDSFSFKSSIVINCAGVSSDKIAQMAGLDIEKLGYKIYPCKGQYFRIANPKKFTINHLIYPVPTDISLGIHITPDSAGGLRLGPDAEYVDKIDYNINEEDKQAFFESVRELLPGLEQQDLVADTAGIRAKLQKEGEGFRDFVIREESVCGFTGFINIIGIESPGLTSCLAIAGSVLDLVKK